MCDEDLLVRVGTGDRAAFMCLYDRFAPRVYGLLVKLMGERADAEDALQVVVLDIWRRAGGYNPELSSAASWILMVARARGIDAIRKRARTESADTSLVHNMEHMDTAPQHGLTGAMSGLLTVLTEEQRSVVELAFYRGLTREQIAGSLGVPVGTVKTRIRAAVKRLGEVLSEKGGGA